MSNSKPRSAKLLSICLLLCIVTVGVWAISLRQVLQSGFAAAGARWQIAAVDGCILIVGTRVAASDPNVHDTLTVRSTGGLGFVMPDVGRGAPPFDYYGRLPFWLVLFVLGPLTASLWLLAARVAPQATCPACAAAVPPGAAVCPACGRACEAEAENAAGQEMAGGAACSTGEYGDDEAPPRRE